MRDMRKAEEIAAKRVQLLSPLLAEGLDAAKAAQIKRSICQEADVSERTLRRYLAMYRAEGFEGLKPRGRGQDRGEDAVPASVLEQAILLRREVPSRSVTQIIQILEWEGLIEPGRIKRSTLQEKLAEKGYSSPAHADVHRNRRGRQAVSEAAPEPAMALRHQVWAVFAHRQGWCQEAGLSGYLY